MIFANQAELDGCVVKWQKILRLQDWDIRAKIAATTRELGIDPPDAMVNVNHKRRCATILLNPEPGAHKDIWPVDQEQNVVHELVHIFTEPFWPEDKGEDSCKWMLAEQCVDSLANALIALDRRTIKPA